MAPSNSHKEDQNLSRRPDNSKSDRVHSRVGSFSSQDVDCCASEELEAVQGNAPISKFCLIQTAKKLCVFKSCYTPANHLIKVKGVAVFDTYVGMF